MVYKKNDNLVGLVKINIEHWWRGGVTHCEALNNLVSSTKHWMWTMLMWDASVGGGGWICSLEELSSTGLEFLGVLVNRMPSLASNHCVACYILHTKIKKGADLYIEFYKTAHLPHSLISWVVCVVAHQENLELKAWLHDHEFYSKNGIRSQVFKVCYRGRG